MSLNKRACRQIAALRNEASIPLVSLAEKTGLSKSAVGRICTGKKVTVTVEEYVNLINALSASPVAAFKSLINEHA